MAKDKIESAIKSGVKVDFCKLSRTNVGMQCRSFSRVKAHKDLASFTI